MLSSEDANEILIFWRAARNGKLSTGAKSGDEFVSERVCFSKVTRSLQRDRESFCKNRQLKKLQSF
jgi:hypothetical protein